MKTQPHLTTVFLRFGGLVFPFFALFFLISTFQAAQAAGEGNALEFDGASDYIKFTRPLGEIIGPTWSQTKTVSVWVKPTTAAPQVNGAFGGDLIVGDHPRWFGIYWANTDGQDKFWIVNVTMEVVGGVTRTVSTRTSIPHTFGEWAYITMVHANDTIRVYKNGVLIDSIATGPTALYHHGRDSGITLRIGGHIQQNSWETLFTGLIDEVRLWDTALTADQIRQNMYRPLTGSEPNLSAYYNMSSSSGITLTDQTGNGWDGTLVDGYDDGNPGTTENWPPDGDTAAWVTSTAFAGPRNALDFDGVDDYVALGSNAQTLIGGSWANSKTIDLWLQPVSSGPAAANAAAGKLLVGGANWGISQANVGGQDSLWVWNNDGNEDRIAIPYTPLLWTHVALVHDGGTLTAYKDGKLIGSVASGATNGDALVYVGGQPGGQNFEGTIDELRFWDYGRTQSEIQAQESLSQTLAYNHTGLTAYYRFDQYNDSDQTILYDTTYGNHNGTLVNMDSNADWVTSGAFGIQADRNLTVNLAGTGNGFVNSTPPGIDCNADCSQTYTENTVVTLTATAATGSTFAGWDGDCTGTGSCVVIMDASRNITATFTLDTYDLTVGLDGTGGGSVNSDPPGINCGGDCSQTYDYGTVITLTATPDPGSSFVGWSGACNGVGDCNIMIDETKNVTATFTLGTNILTVLKDGSGSGSVTSNPAGIECGVNCATVFDFGKVVTLTAVADPGSSFTGWSGDCAGTGNCVVTMDAARDVTATFTSYYIFLPTIIASP